MRKKKQKKLGFGAFLAIFFAIVVLFAVCEIKLNHETNAAEAEYAALKARNQELQDEYLELQEELNFVRSEEGIELYARSLGMQKAGETRYSPVYN